MLKKIQMEKKEIVIGMDQILDFLKVHKHNFTMELLDIKLANDVLPVLLNLQELPNPQQC